MSKKKIFKWTLGIIAALSLGFIALDMLAAHILHERAVARNHAFFNQKWTPPKTEKW